jgi:hypothetical protein
MKTRAYSKPIFSGKEVPFVGIAEGHGPLYRGNTVEFSLNLGYKGSMEMRDGMTINEEFSGSIHAGHLGQARLICEGSKAWSK